MTTTPLMLTWALLRAYIRLSEHPGWAAYLLRPVLALASCEYILHTASFRRRRAAEHTARLDEGC